MKEYQSNIKIYTFYYKNGPILVSDEVYVPVMAGNVYTGDLPGYLGDNTGIHISEKNRTYSELTGIYWAWKNTNQDIVGSCHYRRYFIGNQKSYRFLLKEALHKMITTFYKKRYGLIYSKNSKDSHAHIIKQEEITEILKKYDAILPIPRKLKYSVREHYGRYHNHIDLEIIENILYEKYPEYIVAYKEVMANNRLYANNMFIFKKHQFQHCANWWFDVLFEFEKRINQSDYSGYQERVMGFMAERLFNVWLYKQNLRVKELPVIYFKNMKRA